MTTVELQDGSYLMADKIEYIKIEHGYKTIQLEPIEPSLVGVQFDSVPVERHIDIANIVAWTHETKYTLGSYELHEGKNQNQVDKILRDLINHISTNRDFEMPEDEFSYKKGGIDNAD